MEENKLPLEEEVPNLSTDEAPPVESEAAESIETMKNKLQQKIEELEDKNLRLLAEFQNFKRRTAEEKLVLNQTAGKEMIVALLDVMDDCDRAENQILNSESKDSNEGTLLVFNKLRNLLQQKGVQAMESLDTEFDPEKHEAISIVDAPTEMSGKIINELQKGYYLNEKLIRFAKVVVGK
jgi:molecular chaperone GrpE